MAFEDPGIYILAHESTKEDGETGRELLKKLGGTEVPASHGGEGGHLQEVLQICPEYEELVMHNFYDLGQVWIEVFVSPETFEQLLKDGGVITD